MNSNFIVTFFIGILVYLVILGVYSLIKYFVNKRKVNKEIKQNEEKQDKDNNSKE